jgi:aspartyl-tRNA(Asn)/glutamyl-tRNA(Gln) amidotransferase subunit A
VNRLKEILKGSIINLANLYRSKQLSPVELVSYLFSCIEKEEPELNAFISLFEKDALASAQKAEALFLQGKPTHLLTGVPYSLKDLFYTRGRLTTCGSTILKDFIPDHNAAVVEKLMDTGAILIGKTNMLEFAYGIVHPKYKQTNNPWDLNKTAGGSSGGSAASVAAGLGFFSMGSDTGGSIRIPASYCGVAGLKPTYDAISVQGVFPLSRSLDHAGPIAKSAADLLLVWDAISESNTQGSLDEIKRIGILPDSYFRSIECDIREVYNHSLDIAEELGWQLVTVEIPGWEKTEDILMRILLPEAAQIHKHWLHRKQDYAPLTFSQLKLGMEQKAVDYLEGLQQQKEFRETVSEIFTKVDALLMPTVAFPAPAEDPVIGDHDKNEMTFTGPFNVSGHPAVTINLGYSNEGMPIGMQLAGPLNKDRELLLIARAFEQGANLKKG